MAELSPITYCLYLRQQEAGEAEAVSVLLQAQEMQKVAEKEGFVIYKTIMEKPGAPGNDRPGFRAMLGEIEQGLYSGILVWAPDRLACVPEDMGSFFQLMTQGKLKRIRTYDRVWM